MKRRRTSLTAPAAEGMCVRCKTRVGTHEEPGDVLACSWCCRCPGLHDPPPRPDPPPAVEQRAAIPQAAWAAPAPALDAPTCVDCGTVMWKTGPCYTCPGCGWSGGCG